MRVINAFESVGCYLGCALARLVAASRIFASWNRLDRWLRQVEGLRRVA